jgi:hypothetical protein
MNIPARFAIAMTDELQMIQRNEIIWHKPACMPSSATDRFTVDFEKIFMFAKSDKPTLWLNTKTKERRDIKHKPDLIGQENIDWQWGEKDGEPIKKTYWVRQDYKFNQQLELAAEVSIARGKRGMNVNKNTNGAPGQTPHSMAQPRGYDSSREVSEVRNKRCVWTVNFEPNSLAVKTDRWERVSMDDASGDTMHIPFPDCPYYGGLFDLAANVLCGEPLNNNLMPHILHTCKNLSLTPKDGFDTIDQLRAWNFGQENSDLLLRLNVVIANDHNNQSHKTGLFVSTNLFDMPSVERTSRIERILTEHGWFVPNRDNAKSSISASDLSGDGSPSSTGEKAARSGV